MDQMADQLRHNLPWSTIDLLETDEGSGKVVGRL